MGGLFWAYQFVAGLKRNLQSKVAGIEGDFSRTVVVESYFEEAKIRDPTFQSDRCPGSGNSSHNGLRRSTPAGQPGKPTSGSRPNPREGVDRYFTCR